MCSCNQSYYSGGWDGSPTPHRSTCPAHGVDYRTGGYGVRGGAYSGGGSGSDVSQLAQAVAELSKQIAELCRLFAAKENPE